jgi:hypothetical protein
MLRYALTIFLGAFLLFQVQPLISKIILPWFGGTPAVWTTCMLFFQVLLLGGYAYAHGVATKLGQRKQVVLHLLVLAAAAAMLPIAPGEGWKPETVENPTGQILLLLAVCVGLPYFVLATTSPLLQAWFHRTHPGRRPYRLYALSNAGSLLALVTFPFLVEPHLPSPTQSWVWSGAFVLFAVFCAVCALRTWRLGPAPELDGHDAAGMGLAVPDTAPAEEEGAGDEGPGLMRRLMWLALAACGSTMLLAVTNQMCQDVAVVPFLWVLPLSLYLLTFIICFDSERWYVRPVFWLWLVAAVVGMTVLLRVGVDAPIQWQIAGFSLGLFGCCMVCHGELVRLKPHPRHLTGFYLMVSAGGALGGVFVSLIAPVVFESYIELHIGLWATCALAMAAFWLDKRPHRYWPSSWLVRLGVPLFVLAPFVVLAYHPFHQWEWLESPLPATDVLAIWAGLAGVLFVLWLEWRPSGQWEGQWVWLLCLPAFAAALLLLGRELWWQVEWERTGAVAVSRNFYGVLRVTEYYDHDPDRHQYVLMHGRISHGCQLLSREGRRRPVSYFAPESGIGLTLTHHPRRPGPLRVGIIGLGVGTIAAYGRPGDTFRFYEINAAVKRFAWTLFSYLGDSAADCKVILGDGRLSLEREEEQQFDVLILDAFSGDAVPVHLLTREAFAMYLERLRPDGVIAVQITNRYLDLYPVCAAMADEFGLEHIQVDTYSDESRAISASSQVLLTRNRSFLDLPVIADAACEPEEDPDRRILWTDTYSDLFRIIK